MVIADMVPFPAVCGRKETSQSLPSETRVVRYSISFEDDHWCWTSGWR
jgi:hypothetical protein